MQQQVLFHSDQTKHMVTRFFRVADAFEQAYEQADDKGLPYEPVVDAHASDLRRYFPARLLDNGLYQLFIQGLEEKVPAHIFAAIQALRRQHPGLRTF